MRASRLNLLLALLMVTTPLGTVACAQGTIRQDGAVTAFHLPAWSGSGVQIDAGKVGTPYINALGLFNGANCPFGVSSQTAPGSNTGLYSQLSICQTPTTTTFVVQGMNGQATPNVFFKIGNTLYPFPAGGGGGGGGTVTGPGTTIVGDIACWNSTNGILLSDCGPLGTAAAKNIGTSGATVPLLSASNFWGAIQQYCFSPLAGCVGPRMGNILDLVGPNQGENNQIDVFAYNGFSQYMIERWDFNSGTGMFQAVGSGEVIGGYGAAALDGTPGGGGVGDPADAFVGFATTEAQTVTHNGMGVDLEFTPNTTTALTRGLGVSVGGLGGVTIGGSGWAASVSGPTDLGTGTLNAASDLSTQGHFRSGGTHPAVSSCGGGSPSVTGTDNAGKVATGSGTVNSCTVTFSQTFPGTVICQVQTLNNASPVSFVSSGPSGTPTVMVVGFSASLNGSFSYLCQGAT